jgi:hypothetical protein
VNPAVPHTALLILYAVETGLLCLAAYLLCRAKGVPPVEAAAGAPILVLLLLTALYQQYLMLGVWIATLLLEAMICSAGVWQLWQHRSILAKDMTLFKPRLQAHSVVFCSLATVLLYLGCQALLLSFPEHRGELCAVDNTRPLALMLQKHGLSSGDGLFSFLAYLSIGCATYALARRHAWPDTAFITALAVSSLPWLVLLATAPVQDNAIVFAAMFLFLLLTCYRLIETPGIHDLAAATAAALFCFSGNPLQVSLTVVLLLLTATLLNRRHGRTPWLRLLTQNRRVVLLYLVPLSVMLAFLAYPSVPRGKRPSSCPPLSIANNPHGLQGAMANLVRFGVESINLTPALDAGGELLAGKRPTLTLQQAYDHLVAPWAMGRGAGVPFTVRWELSRDHAGFGPAGFLLILPALGYCLLRGPRRLKSVALAFTGYLLLVCLVAAWHPGYAIHTGYLYICSGFLVAHFLPPWRLKRGARKVICAVCLALLVATATGNADKPIADLDMAATGLHNILTGRISLGIENMGSALKRGAWYPLLPATE